MFSKADWEVMKSKGLFEAYPTYEDWRFKDVPEEKREYLSWKERELSKEDRKKYDRIFDEGKFDETLIF